ncbi:hypothetical protein GCM10009539_74140 [Cryptosporangium japonicum]|uniref:Uncharacterized protein n=1 Tax=Cryptosporangium japonicum TaxID=80872 RepID=A0ABP3ES79_9ACTN
MERPLGSKAKRPRALAALSDVARTRSGAGWGQRGAKQHGTKQHGTKQHGTKQHGTKQHGTKQHGTKQHGAKQHGAKQHGTKQHGTKQHGTKQHGAKQHGAKQHGAKQHGAKQHGAKQHGAKQHGAGVAQRGMAAAMRGAERPDCGPEQAERPSAVWAAWRDAERISGRGGSAQGTRQGIRRGRGRAPWPGTGMGVNQANSARPEAAPRGGRSGLHAARLSAGRSERDLARDDPSATQGRATQAWGPLGTARLGSEPRSCASSGDR